MWTPIPLSDGAPAPGERIALLDGLRGIAVMGILLMNITAFALPDAAYLQPTVAGGTSLPDLLSWALAIVLVDGKMRGLFSILFGASMWIVWTGAEAAGGDGRAVHRRRMGWLLVFGLVHYFLIWPGDILTLYALCGLAAGFFVTMDEGDLPRHAIALFIANALVFGIMGGVMLWMKWEGTAPGASPDAVAAWQDMVAALGGSASDTAKETTRALGHWADAVLWRVTEDATGPLVLLMVYGAETLGLMVLGMAGLRSGALPGGWSDARLASAMRRCYLIGLPPLVGLVAWDWATGFDPLTNFLFFSVLATPFRLAVTLGHAALAIRVMQRLFGTALAARITAAGRAAFTNYLGTSVLMTTLFNGWGLAQFGQWSRWQLYLIVPVVWGVMLLWSKPWLDRYRYGPMEWLWRSLARGALQPLRR